MDLVALKTELKTDPAAIGYAAFGSDHEAIAKLINTAQRQVPDRGQKPTSALLSVLDLGEIQTAIVVPAKASLLQMLCSMPTIDMDDKGLRAWLVSIFGAQSETVKAVSKAAKRTGTRAEELGFGRVTESNVADALLRT